MVKIDRDYWDKVRPPSSTSLAKRKFKADRKKARKRLKLKREERRRKR